MHVRIEVAIRPEFSDPAANAFLRRLEQSHPELRRKVRWARVLDIYWLDTSAQRSQLIPAITEMFWDPVLNLLFTGDLIPSASGRHGGIQDLLDAAPYRSGGFWGLERRFRPGVTDNVARTTLEALEIVLGTKLDNARAASGQLLLVEGPELGDNDLTTLARDVFCNELIESWTVRTHDELKKIERFQPDQVKWELPKVLIRNHAQAKAAPVMTYDLGKLSDKQLEELSRKSLWALTLAEMQAIRGHYNDPATQQKRQAMGLGLPTDVEMEVLAQTWSEHCKHKLFNARIAYSENIAEESARGVSTRIPKKVESLFQETVAGTTREIERPWLLSVFKDNAGIVAFDEEDAVCVKVETHNSPSALDPYGGALTGIVGVNRDILGCGLGAKPIFNTDVFCLAAPDFASPLPDRIFHPRRILAGVRRGVEHGGNKSGIPTVNGALVFDQRYLGKPLVYCGTGGILPLKIDGRPCESKEVKPGDRICMVGGRIGKDGIHGATFSSLALDENSPVTAVQLGDPITQKRAADFLLQARDLGLYRALTDNGAGGLSSSVGELSTISNGARMDVARALTKYPGLKPYELVVSESQERMTVVVPPEKLKAFLALAASRDVEVSDLGEFTDTGYFEILHDQKIVGLLNLEFLHDGVPKLELEAVWTGMPPSPGAVELSFDKEAPVRLLELLARPGIASKEWLIRQYDHEVQGTSVVKPLHTVNSGTTEAWSGPNDAAVIKPKPHSAAGLVVGCGIQPKFSDLDPYLMAQAAVDEAIRNILCVGAEFGTKKALVALIDNFCWPDPVADTGKAAALVRACYGMKEAALALEAPLISGKDSMKNDFRGKREGKDVTISVVPTLLMTAVGRIADVRFARTSDFKALGDQIYLLGGEGLGLYGSELHAACSDKLRERGGNEKQVVVPSSAPGKKGLRAPSANWEMAQDLYGWIGRAKGELQAQLRSMHDLSEGGLLVALAECLLARGLGAAIDLKEIEDPWEFSFGEGFHSFLITASAKDAKNLEDEWKRYRIPFRHLGSVTNRGALEVSIEGQRSWSLPITELRRAWVREDYWE
ncbi:MAG: AIR synthase-related protein [Bacteriovoracia bacterium]